MLLTIAIAERAKDFYFRYFGRTVARLPLPVLSPPSSDFMDAPFFARRAARAAKSGSRRR